MAPKPPTEKSSTELLELISALRTELEVLRAQLSILHKEMELSRSEFAQLRDRVIKVESLLGVLETAEMFKQVPRLQEQVSELKKWKEERERRGFQFWLGIGICIFTFTLNFAVNLVLFFTRKPG